MPVDRTITYTEETTDNQIVTIPYLALAMECARPTIGGARIALGPVEVVSIGRGNARDLGRPKTEDGRAVLRVELPDGWMSTKHARLVRSPKEWAIEDVGSKNGTFVNGVRIDDKRVVLNDGDVLTVGGSLFLFQPQVKRPLRAPPNLRATDPVDHPVTLSFAMRTIYDTLRSVARSITPVIVGGETGTGKELAARFVHEQSGRSGAFIPINCGALTESILESELFGKTEGAFTGARSSTGLVGSADGGTLFLDEIGEMSEAAQVFLLRVLQEGEIRPVGASAPVAVDVRIVAATHQDLPAKVEAGRFRTDLYARLAGCEVTLPPLADRPEDIGPIVSVLVERMATDPGRVSWKNKVGQALLGYAWPLNVRELEQCVRSALAQAFDTNDGTVTLEHLPDAVRVAAELAQSDDDVLRDRIVHQLRQHAGNVSAVAREMGHTRLQIRRWCERLEINVDTFRP